MLGGGEHSLLDVLAVMRQQWEPLVIVPSEGELSQRLVRNKIEVRIIPMPAVRPWYTLRTITALKKIASVCSRYGAKTLYASGTRAAVYGGIVARFIRRPLVWHCRVADRDRVLDPLLVKLSTKIIVNSCATAARFSGMARKKVTVIYNGLDLDWLQNGFSTGNQMIRNDWKVILSVSRVSRWKRHDVILSAFEKVAGLDPALHLVCVGDRDHHQMDWWKALQQRTRQSRFSERIHWIGQVDDVRPWYATASMLVHASDNEPFGRVLVEAMAARLPVVATRGGGIPEIVRHGKDGPLVPPGDADQMAESIEKILSNDQLRNRLAASGLSRSKQFDRSRLAARILQLFNDLSTVGQSTTNSRPNAEN